MPFRIKYIKKDKLFQAAVRAHNVWPLFCKARPEEFTVSLTMGTVEEIQQASNASLEPSTSSWQSTCSPVCTFPARLVIHRHLHGYTLKLSPGAAGYEPKLCLYGLCRGRICLPCLWLRVNVQSLNQSQVSSVDHKFVLALLVYSLRVFAA